MIRVVLGGLGGYSRHYLTAYKNLYDHDEIRYVAAVDPFAADTPALRMAEELGIPVCRDFEACLDEYRPDIAFLATPINTHMSQILACFRRGIHVLCEKPLAADMEEIEIIRDARDASGCLLAVGFQWCFAKSMRALKEDIASGLFGTPLHMTATVFWQRPYTYYTNSPWKGRILNAQGDPVHDSILTNATAHYLQNIFFLLDDEAAWADVLTLRGYDIETFDTCFLHGELKKGGDFTVCVTHVGEENEDPHLLYEFENGTIRYDMAVDRLYAEMADGTVREYGTAYSPADTAEKEFIAARAVRDGGSVPCTIEDVMAFSRFCEEVFRRSDRFLPFEDGFVRHVENAGENRWTMRQVPGLVPLMRACAAEHRVPRGDEYASCGIPAGAAYRIS